MSDVACEVAPKWCYNMLPIPNALMDHIKTLQIMSKLLPLILQIIGCMKILLSKKNL